jgi:hypothetical protein
VKTDGRSTGFTQFRKYLSQAIRRRVEIGHLVLNIAGCRLLMTVTELQRSPITDVCIRKLYVTIATGSLTLGWNQFVQYVVERQYALTGEDIEFHLPTGMIKLHVKSVAGINSRKFTYLIAQ